MMRIAAIDIGTNSLHMIVVRVRADLSFEVIDREKEMVRLGVSRAVLEVGRIKDRDVGPPAAPVSAPELQTRTGDARPGRDRR